MRALCIGVALAISCPAAAAEPDPMWHYDADVDALAQNGQFEAAEALAREGLKARQRDLEPAHHAIGTILTRLAFLRAMQRDFDGALERVDQAVAILTQHPDAAAELGVALLYRARVLFFRGDADGADRALEEGREALRDGSGADHPAAAALVDEMARFAEGRGDNASAERWFRESLAIRRALLDAGDPEIALSLVEVGRLRGIARDPAAIGLYREALDLTVPALGATHPRVLKVRSWLAIALWNDHRLEEAREQAEIALAGAREAHGADSPEVAAALRTLGELHRDLGEYIAARDLFEEAAAIYREAGHPLLYTALSDVGTIARRLGEFDKAAALYTESLVMLRDLGKGSTWEAAVTLNNLALAQRMMGDHDTAREHYTEALSIHRASGDQNGLSTTLGNLGRVEKMEGNLERARALLTEALEIRREIRGPRHPSTASTLHNLAEVVRAEGDLEAARAMFEETLDIRTESLGRYHPKVIVGLNSLADLLHQMGDEGFRPLQVEALALVESRLSLLDDLSERAALDYVATTSRNTLDRWLATVDVPAIEGWAHTLRFKGAVADLLERGRVVASDDEEAAAIASELRAVRRELAGVMFSAGESGEQSALEGRREKLERALNQRSALFAAAARGQDPEALCEALPPETALVDFLRYENRGMEYLAFVVDADCAVHRVELGPASVIEEAVAEWRGVLADPDAVITRVDARGEIVRRAVWDPIAPHVESAGRIVAIPDGPLAGVPFGALPVGDARYLLEDTHISYLDRAGDLLRSVESGRGGLVVGAVDYDARVDSPSEAFAAACAEGDYEPLPGTGAEASAVAGSWRRSAGELRLLEGADATEANVVGALAGKGLVHLATHGFFATGRCRSQLEGGSFDPMLLSGLVLAGANNEGSEGILTAAEIAAVDLSNTGLVVLSACDTGMGEIRSGEGVLGLRRAFSVAGVGALLTSLWAIPDAETAALMEGFYGYHLRRRRPMSAADALRQAQLDRLDGQRRDGVVSPLAWAGFVASGL